MVQNILRPSIRQPDSVRVATRARPGEVLAALADRGGQHDAVAGDLLPARRRSARARRSAPAATATWRRRSMLSTATRCMFTPIATEASPRARRLDATTRSCAEETPSPPSSTGIGRCEVAGGLERVDRLERVGAVAVVLGCAGGELLRELLGESPRGGRRRRYGL